MKRLIAPILIGAVFGSFAMAKDMDMKAEIEALKTQMNELKAAQKKMNVTALRKQFYEVKAHDAHDNIKFTADLRTAYDVIDYKISNAAGAKSSVSNSIWTNKFTLKMAAQPRDDLVFHGALGIYKAFGVNNGAAYNGFQNFDWYADETPSGDAVFRLKEAYFIYFGNASGKVPYTVSFGRRPATDGFLTNYRDYKDRPASPIGHNINMEFDGASFMAKLENVTGIPGFSAKLCIGRGNSNADGKYPTFTGYNGSNLTVNKMMSLALPYAKSNTDSANMDLAGIIMDLYYDGQYTVMFNYFKAWNMMGADFTNLNTNSNPMLSTYSANLVDVGDMTGGALSFQSSGIGDGISDFLDDTNVFASFAWNKTDPKGSHSTLFNAMGFGTPGAEMLGSPNSETGTSYYIGTNFPCMLVDGARWGLEYNHGSKYWRSFDYGEDTLIGSKLSTRGDAYEVFYNLPILGQYLTAQVRYTYINYNYTGSDMFFGSTGTPMTKSEAAAQGMGFVDSASDLRLFIRYMY